MTIEERVRFELDLQDFAHKRGMHLVEMPTFVWRGGWIEEQKSGTALWPNYDADGSIAEGFTVQFKPFPKLPTP